MNEKIDVLDSNNNIKSKREQTLLNKDINNKTHITNYNLLLVDDSSIIRRVLVKTILSTDLFKAHISQASDAKEALEILEISTFDMIISDKEMPGMGGLELLEIVGKKWPDTKKVLLSGYSSSSSKNTGNIVDLCIEKPWDNHKLLESIASLLSKR